MRVISAVAVLGAGIAVGAVATLVAQRVLGVEPTASKDVGKANPGSKETNKPGKKDRHAEGDEGQIKMSPEKVVAAKIGVAQVGHGTLARRIIAPGTVATDPDRVARIGAKVVGTVAELRER